MKRTKHSTPPAEKKRRRMPSMPTVNFSGALKSEQFWGTLLAAILLFATIYTAVTVRQAPVTMDVADVWAANSVNQQGISFFTQQVRSEYPLLADAQVQQRAQQQWNEYQQANSAEIEAQKKQVADVLRANYQYEATTADGTKYQQTYIFEMDPYYFLQKAVNFANTDSPCELGSEVLADGRCRDAKRLAPIGTLEGADLHVRFEALLISFARSRGITDPITAVFLLPVILIGIAAIPAFFIARRFGGNVGGFVAAMILVLHPVIMNRTVAGWADTDAYAIVFPLFIIWLALEAYEAKRWWSRLSFATLAGIVTGIYSKAWGGWWFMLFVIVLSMASFLAYRILVLLRRQELRDTRSLASLGPAAAVLGLYLLVTGIVVALMSGIKVFFIAFIQPFLASSSLQAATSVANVGWPNILTTVAELNVPSISAIVSNFSGGQPLVVILAAFGLFAILLNPRKVTWHTGLVALAVFAYYFVIFTQALTMSRYAFLALFALPLIAAVLYHVVRDKELDLHANIFILGWLLATFFAATQGVRFVLLGIPPFAIGFGIAIGWIAIALATLLAKPWPKYRLAINAGVSLLILLIVFNPVAAQNPIKTGQAAALQQAPGINDAWWESMRYLREDTPTDTIVTSWWDFGHWFRNIGNRSVTFDGGSQNPEPGHWVGKALLTNNEREAVGILRMLNCGQNSAFEAAEPELGTVQAKHLIDSLLVVDRREAQRILADAGLSDEAQSAVLEATHCSPRTQVFITSGDMIGKAGVWGHFGGWDFTRSMAYYWATTLSQEQAVANLEATGLSKPDATALYYDARKLASSAEANTWISGWPGYLSSMVNCQQARANETLIACQFNANAGASQQGNLVLETIAFQPSRPADAAAQIGVYQNGQRAGGTVVRLPRVVLADQRTGTMTPYETGAQELTLGVLIVETPGANGGASTYKALIADPQQLDSMFTKLYFLGTDFTESFTPLSRTTEISGGVVTIWGVTWPDE